MPPGSELSADRVNVRVDGVNLTLSDHGGLTATFLARPCPRMFMYGEQNSSLSYLAKLSASGVTLAEIPYSAHWPMYYNPVAMWERIARFHSHETPD